MDVELPPSFQCPYRKACWSREAVRVLVAAVVTILTLKLAGCVMSIRAPGLSFDSRPSWPTTTAAETPK